MSLISPPPDRTKPSNRESLIVKFKFTDPQNIKKMQQIFKKDSGDVAQKKSLIVKLKFNDPRNVKLIQDMYKKDSGDSMKLDVPSIHRSSSSHAQMADGPGPEIHRQRSTSLIKRSPGTDDKNSSSFFFSHSQMAKGSGSIIHRQHSPGTGDKGSSGSFFSRIQMANGFSPEVYRQHPTSLIEHSTGTGDKGSFSSSSSHAHMANGSGPEIYRQHPTSLIEHSTGTGDKGSSRSSGKTTSSSDLNQSWKRIASPFEHNRERKKSKIAFGQTADENPKTKKRDEKELIKNPVDVNALEQWYTLMVKVEISRVEMKFLYEELKDLSSDDVRVAVEAIGEMCKGILAKLK